MYIQFLMVVYAHNAAATKTPESCPFMIYCCIFLEI